MPQWGDKRYHSLNFELKKTFGQKVIKLAVDGGFTCPNRDGSKGYGGCTFCSSSGSGEYAGSRQKTIREQLEQQIRLLSPKWKEALYIPYFQNFSNTYADLDTLRSKYDEALSFPQSVGLAVATRPDCIDESIASLLAEYHRKTYLWVELGIQTVHEKTAERIRRGCTVDEIERAFDLLRQQGIRIVAHVILNLPGETRSDYFDTLRYLIDHNIHGLKIHMLNIIQGTSLAAEYADSPFPLMTREEYITLICDILEFLPKDIIIHRMTGDAAKDSLIAPRWICDKRAVLNGIDKELRRRNTHQGFLYK